jgi:hypothetical protein
MSMLTYTARSPVTTLLRSIATLAARIFGASQPSARQTLCDGWANASPDERDEFVSTNLTEVWEAFEHATAPR